MRLSQTRVCVKITIIIFSESKERETDFIRFFFSRLTLNIVHCRYPHSDARKFCFMRIANMLNSKLISKQTNTRTLTRK